MFSSKQYSETDLLALIAASESKSEHPLGKAIVSKAKKENVVLSETEDFRMEAGKGIYAKISGKHVLCGSEKFMTEKGIIISEEVIDKLAIFRKEGKAPFLPPVNDKCVGAIALSDILRPDAAEMIKRLEATGTKTILLTGDNRQTADYFAYKDRYHKYPC